MSLLSLKSDTCRRACHVSQLSWLLPSRTLWELLVTEGVLCRSMVRKQPWTPAHPVSHGEETAPNCTHTSGLGDWEKQAFLCEKKLFGQVSCVPCKIS